MSDVKTAKSHPLNTLNRFSRTPTYILTNMQDHKHHCQFFVYLEKSRLKGYKIQCFDLRNGAKS